MATDEELQREITYWRELLTRVAEDLEHAAESEADGKRKAWFSSRAMRIRQRLHEGLPENFTSDSGHQRMSPRG
jgi:hypothetical protein